MLDHRVLSESKPITSVDFNDRAQIEKLVEDSSEIQVEIPIDKDGYLDAAILYFELAVDKSAKHVISSGRLNMFHDLFESNFDLTN